MTVYPCPRCGYPSPPEECAVCGRGPEPLLAELGDVDLRIAAADQRLRGLEMDLADARGRRGRLAMERTRVLARLGERERAARAALVPVPPPPPPAPMPAAPPVVRPKKETSGKVAQNTLLTLGAILAAVAGISFTTVAWVTFGTGGRASILGVVTLVALALPFLLARKNLRSTAEAVSAVGLLLVVLDGFALWLLGVVSDVGAGLFVGWTSLGAAVLGLGYHRLSGLLVPLYAVPALGAFAAVVALTRDHTLTGLVMLVAVTALAATAAYAGRDRIAAELTGGLTAASVIALVSYVSVRDLPGVTPLVPAVAAIGVLVAARRMPATRRMGPLVVGVACTGVVAVVAVAVVLTLIGRALMDVQGMPARMWQAPVIVALLAAAEFAVPPHRRRRLVAEIAVPLVVFALPGAFWLDRMYTVPVLLAAAIVAAFTGRDAVRAASAGAAALFALGLSIPDERYLAGSLTVLALAGVALAIWRSRSAGVAVAVLTPPCALGLWTDLAGASLTHSAALTLGGAAVLLAVIPLVERASLPLAAAGAGLLVAAGAVVIALPGRMEMSVASLAVVAALAAFAGALESATTGPTRAIASGSGVVIAVAVVAAWVYNMTIGFALVAAVVAASVAGALSLLLPAESRRGPMGGAAVAGGATALAAGLAALNATSTQVSVWSGPPVGTVVRVFGWQPPVVLLVVGVAAALLWRGPRRHHVPLAALGLAAVSAPVAWRLEWPVAPVVAMTVAVGLAVSVRFADRFALVRFGAGAVLGLYAVTGALATPTATLAAGGTIAAAGALVAVAGRVEIARGLSAGAALLVPPGIAVSAIAVFAPDASVRTYLLTAMGASVVALLITVTLRGSANLRYATVAVPVGASVTAFASLATDEPTRLYAALAGLIGLGAAMLDRPDRARLRVPLAAPSLMLAAVVSLAPAVAPVLYPYGWLRDVWGRVPASTVDGLAPRPPTGIGTVLDVWVLAAVAAAVIIAVVGLARRWTLPAAIGGAGVTVLAAPVALDMPWPVGPLTALAIAVAALLVAALGKPGPPALTCLIIAAVVGAPALSWSLATPTTTLIATGALVATGAVVAIYAPARRDAGLVVSGLALTATGAAAGLAAGLPREWAAIGVLAAAVVQLAAAGILRNRPLEVTAHAGLLVALGLAAAGPRPLAIVLAVYGAALGAYALRAGRLYALAATAAELAAYWLLLAAADVGAIEAYSLPAAVLALGAGLVEFLRRANLGSWVAFAPGLLAAFLPTLAPVLISHGDPWRRLALGAGALVVLLAGAARRLQAPTVLGAIVLIAVAVHELALLWTLVPAWLPIAVAAVLLLATGATFEHRRRDFNRLRQAVGGMR